MTAVCRCAWFFGKTVFHRGLDTLYGERVGIMIGGIGVLARFARIVAFLNTGLTVTSIKGESQMTTRLKHIVALFLLTIAMLAGSASAVTLNTWTWRNPLPTGESLNGVTYGSGQFVVVSVSGLILTSPDGGTWTSRTSGNNLRAVTYGGGQFVAVGDGNTTSTIVTSPDGVTWTSRVSGTTTTSLDSVTYGGGQFMAVGPNDTIVTSPDGVTWTSRVSGTTGTSFNGVIYGSGQFVVVGFNGEIITSPDGVTWTSRVSGTTGISFNGVTYGGGKFVAVGAGGVIVTSPDGVTWTSRVSGSTSTLSGVTYGGGQFVAVIYSLVTLTSSATILTSLDGVIWTPRVSGSTTASSVTYGGGQFMVVGLNGTIVTSPDGVTWTTRSSGIRDYLSDITYGGGQFVAVGVNGQGSIPAIATSPDGITWTSRASGVNRTLNGVAFGGGQFVAVGGNGTIVTSPNGVTWTSRPFFDALSNLSKVAYGGGQFVVVGCCYLNAAILTSPDGITWTSRPMSVPGDYLSSVTYGGGQFVAVGGGYPNARIFTSPDGVTWTSRVSGSTSMLSGVTYGGGQFVAVGACAIVTSPDGVTWTDRLGANYLCPTSVTYGGGRFVAVGSGNILTSADGVTWLSQIGWSIGTLNAVAFDGSNFVVVGNVGAILQSGAALPTYTVSATAGTGGTVTPASQSVNRGYGAVFTVTPNAGYFVDFTVGGNCAKGTLSGTTYLTGPITAACSVSFSFTPYVGGLTVSALAGTGGSVTPASRSVASGSRASFTVTPNTGYTTNSTVGGNCAAGTWSGTTYTTGAITAACSVSFSFTVTPAYTVSATAGTGGTVTPASRSVASGSRASFTVTPNAGGYTTNPTVGGNCVAGLWSGTTYTTGVVTAACSVSFAFYPPPSPPTGANGAVGGISSAGGAVLNALVKPNGAATTVTFEYGIDTTYGTTISGGTVTGWTTQTVSSGPLTGLACGTVYHYRITVTNNLGTSVGLDGTFVACVSKTYGDFNGDGKSDILFRNATTGATLIWFMNGATKTGGGATSVSATTGWAVAGVGDFNGDGEADILWRNVTTGATQIWLMNGTTKIGGGATSASAGVYTATTGLQVAGVGDFDGDGKADILWRNAATGATQIWLMNGTAKTGGGGTSAYAGGYTATTGLQVQGVGDFNGDGKADILWRNAATGATQIWLMNGTTKTGGGGTSAYAGGYAAIKVQGVADFNGDGKADILWRNVATGATSIWFMNGVMKIGGGATSAYAGSYAAMQVAGVGDYNGDGKADILWRNATTGATQIWLMNGTSKTGGGGTSAYAGPYTATTGWQIMRKP
jgi:hypothetical protein